jgi:hypothetical protein
MITCPYGCGSTFNEPEDPVSDGYEHEIECDKCEKSFCATTSISVDYDVACSDDNHEDDGSNKHGYKWCKHCENIIK